MDFSKVHKAVSEEFDANIASLVVAALTINLTTKAKLKDISIPGRFTEKINQKTHDLLWEHNREDIVLAIKIRDAWNEFESRQTLEGLGGCTLKSLREIITEDVK